MGSNITITEIKDFDLKDGYIIDGFPYEGYAGSIAAESLVRTSNFEFAGFMDSDVFSPVSIIKDGVPNYPVSIFVNEKLKVAVFLSHFQLSESISKEIAAAILQYAKKHQCKQIISSMKVTGIKIPNGIGAIASTDSARDMIKKIGIDITLNATMRGIPGMLLVQGRFSNQDVIVLLFTEKSVKSTDLAHGAKLCLTIGRLIPKLPCNLKIITNETAKVEKLIKKTQKDSKHLKNAMYG
ncbi:MAG: PAC2 family protein [Nitrosopumilus sp.]|nr:PAC2 family protein [Nitrosopumilus sp.]NRA05997.1 PAC2 family protein [Nitrosopumilus sp.]